MTARKFNLTLEQALPELDAQLLKMRAQEDRTELTRTGMSPDDAMELGYESAIFDLRHYTGPDPLEVNLMIVTPLPEDD